MTENDRAENVADGERQQIAADVLRGHIVEAHQHQAISEKDGVVEERLGEHEDETEHRTPPMFVHDGVPDLAPGCVGAGPDAHRRIRNGVMECWSNGWGRLPFPITPILHYSIPPLLCYRVFNVFDDRFRFRGTPVNQQPARALWNPAPEENNDEPENRAN